MSQSLEILQSLWNVLIRLLEHLDKVRSQSELLPGHEAVGYALSTCSASSSNPMDIVLDVSWHVVVDDGRDVLHIQASRGHISSQKHGRPWDFLVDHSPIYDPRLPAKLLTERDLEASEDLVSLVLQLVTVNASDVHLDSVAESSIVPQVLLQLVYSDLLSTEHDDLLLMLRAVIWVGTDLH